MSAIPQPHPREALVFTQIRIVFGRIERLVPAHRVSEFDNGL
jgi:hypothetical protein